MLKYKALIQYLGTNYAGWQIQSGLATVQGQLREVLSRLAGRPVGVVGASRTDAGVHALGQVAHFLFPVKETIRDLQQTVNALLPWDIRVVGLRRTPIRFHARKDARKKRYEYRIYTGPILPPFLHGRVIHLPRPLDLSAMQEGAARLLGRHDFSAFASSGTSVRDRRRTVMHSQLHRRGHLLVYRVEGDGFLRHMVRTMVGTLLEIGSGRRDPSSIRVLLRSGDRREAGPTAPPEGLYLVKVWYRAAPAQRILRGERS